jgi:SAM-dependent methyltransferase
MFNDRHRLPQDGLAGFADVDRTGYAPAFAAYLDSFQRGFDCMVEASVERLALRAGDRVLDVGCGNGAAFDRLARRIGSEGVIVGLDQSRELLAEARRRAREGRLAVELHAADAACLPLPDGSVDAARADRLLIFLERPADAVSEMVRVTRRGGRIAVTEGDHGTQVIDSQDPETSATVLHHAAAALRSSGVGRRLRALFLEAGLVDVVVDLHGWATTNLDEWWVRQGIDQALGRALDTGATTLERLARWEGDLRARAAQGRFFAAGMFFIASGRHP